MLFRREHYELLETKANLHSIDQRYSAIVNSLQSRSPLDTNEWVSKFVALEKDYLALEKDWNRQQQLIGHLRGVLMEQGQALFDLRYPPQRQSSR
jgi:hypothetical protein